MSQGAKNMKENMSKVRVRLAALCLAWAMPWMSTIAAPAADLPDAGVYDDEDPAAMHLQAPPGMRSQLRARVNAALAKNPRNAPALVHRAYFFLQSGDVDRAMRDFDAAVLAAEPGSVYERNVLWSRGWANYDLGRYQETLQDWQRAARLHGGHPYWLGYSYALLYWTTGEQDAALAWFDAAVAATPEWGTREGLADKTKFWNPVQRERMQAMFAAWQGGRASKEG